MSENLIIRCGNSPIPKKYEAFVLQKDLATLWVEVGREMSGGDPSRVTVSLLNSGAETGSGESTYCTITSGLSIAGKQFSEAFTD
jgi:hypothetical protein